MKSLLLLFCLLSFSYSSLAQEAAPAASAATPAATTAPSTSAPEKKSADEIAAEKEKLVEKIKTDIDEEKEFSKKIFSDEMNVKYLLRSQGIEPVKLDWSNITLICSNLKNIDDVEQNKCKYNQAKKAYLYTQENAFCKKLSENVAANMTINQNEPVRYLMVDAVGRKQEVTLIKIGSRIGKTKNLQTEEYLNCMKSHGWVNPDSWVAGKSE